MSESDRSDGAAVRLPPPVVPLVALGLGLVLQGLLWPLPPLLTGAARWLAGALFCGAGVAVMGAAIQLFRTSGQDPAPWESTPEVIASGIYRWTRNPMYLGMGLLQAGIGLLLANTWVVALVPVTWAVIYAIAIRHEEAYLEGKFGAAYLDYKKSVRRWL